MMEQFQALYYNGESPVAIKASVYATDAALHLDADDGSFALMFPWDEVSDCRLSGERVTITLPSGTRDIPSAHREIVCSNPSLHQQVLPRIIRHRRSIFSLRGNLRKTFIVMAVFAAFSAAFMWGMISQGYRLVPIDVDRQFGKQTIKSISFFSKEYADAAQIKRLNAMAARMKPADSPYTYTVHLVDNPQVNAFAVPGGDIIVFKGLIDAHPSDAELAGVIAHEISHVEYRHGIRQLIRLMGFSYLFHIAGSAGLDQIQGINAINDISSLLLLFKYSRRYELEADANAVRLLKKGKYSTQGLALFLKKMEKLSDGKEPPTYLSTHPATAERIGKIQKMTGR